MNKEQLIEVAQDQMECHQMQVSGVWSISGEDFCRQNGLNYQRALDFEADERYESFSEYVSEERGKLSRSIGELSEEQEEALENYCRGQLDWREGYSSYFWLDILRQIDSMFE